MKLGLGQVFIILVLIFLLFGNLEKLRPATKRLFEKLKKFF